MRPRDVLSQIPGYLPARKGKILLTLPRPISKLRATFESKQYYEHNLRSYDQLRRGLKQLVAIYAVNG